MFDCVLPTRNARNGTLFVPGGQVNIKGARFSEDASPLDETCDCRACTSHSRAYLRHLYLADEILVHRLHAIHNLRFLVRLTEAMREAIRAARFGDFRAEFWAQRQQDPPTP